MGRELLLACLPWLGLLLAAGVVLLLLMRLNGSRPDPRRLARLHRDEVGSVQSLSFVLVLPFFVMVILFIVQVSQLMIGTVVVHYAAYAAARAAIVWIPANLSEYKPENCISARYLDPEALDQVAPSLEGPTDGGLTYVILPEGPKYEKILSAAALACVPIAPSRDLGLVPQGRAAVAADILDRTYRAITQDDGSNPRLTQRLQNKLAYALDQTAIEVRFHHRNREPPLEWSPMFTDVTLADYFRENELGWQDQIRVIVHHNLALLPGPGRFLARSQPPSAGATDEVASRIQRIGGVYVYPLSATITLGNEGEKSVIPYAFPIH